MVINYDTKSKLLIIRSECLPEFTVERANLSAEVQTALEHLVSKITMAECSKHYIRQTEIMPY